MRCPECIRLGIISSVYAQGCQATLMGTSEYWDEMGNYHYNDPNITTCSYRCSNGHIFSAVSGGTILEETK